MKPFQTYIFELTKPHEFRIKMATVNPKDVMEQLKNALNTWQLESISAVKSIPIQEHREFPQWGPCEAWTFDITLAYPTTTVAIRQTIKERANINPDWICVRNLHEAEYTEEAEMVNSDRKGALLDQEDLGGSTEGPALVGQARIGSLLKEIDKLTRTYEIAGNDNTDGDKVVTTGKTTNDKSVPVGNTSTIGTNKNKLQGKRGQ